MRDDSYGKWTIDDDGQFFKLSGGFLDSDKDVISKVEELTGRTVSADWVVGPRNLRKFRRGIRYYYSINHNPDLPLDSIAVDDNKTMSDYANKCNQWMLSDSWFSHFENKEPYYRITLCHRILRHERIKCWWSRNKLIVMTAVFIISLILFIGFLICSMIFKSYTLFLLSLVAMVCSSYYGNCIGVYDKANYKSLPFDILQTSVNDGLLFSIKFNIYDDNSISYYDKAIKQIIRIWKKRASNIDVVSSDNWKFIHIIKNNNKKSSLSYDTNELIHALSCNEPLKRKINLKDYNNSNHVAIQRKYDASMQDLVELKNEIHHLEYSTLADNTISNKVDEELKSFQDAGANSQQAYDTIMNQLVSTRDALKELHASSLGVHDSLSDIRELLRMRKRA